MSVGFLILTVLFIVVSAVMILIILGYIVMGCFLEGIGMVLITVPVFQPIIMKYGYDPIWWGIINVVVVELGMLIPPIGMNVFVIYSIAKNVPLTDIYRGVTPYVMSNLVRLALLLSLPALSLWLPYLVKK